MSVIDRLRNQRPVDPMAEVSATTVAHLREQNLKFQKFMQEKVAELEQKVAEQQQRLPGGPAGDEDYFAGEDFYLPEQEPEAKAEPARPVVVDGGVPLVAEDEEPPAIAPVAAPPEVVQPLPEPSWQDLFVGPAPAGPEAGEAEDGGPGAEQEDWPEAEAAPEEAEAPEDGGPDVGQGWPEDGAAGAGGSSLLVQLPDRPVEEEELPAESELLLAAGLLDEDSEGGEDGAEITIPISDDIGAWS